MKNKRGFLSISVVYSFFVVFLALLLFIVNNFINNRMLLDNMETKIKEDISDMTFARYLTNHSEELGLVHHNSRLENGASDNSYRYVGANPNNYITFNNELYRIIGVIDGKVRIIKNASSISSPVSTKDTNYFINTDIYNYLNTTFLNSLGTSIDLISISTFYVDGLEVSAKTDTLKTVYDNEVGANRHDAIHLNMKIGLLYLSDYAYATDVTNYGKTISGTDNWLNTRQSFWAISRLISSNNEFFYIDSGGNINTSNVSANLQIRPVFSLVSEVKLASGTGTQTDPYRIEV